MQSCAQMMIQLVLDGVVDRDVGANAATNRHDFLVALEAAEKIRQEAEEAAAQAEAVDNGQPAFEQITTGLR